MERYAQMKNSGVGWIQDIPTGWGVRVLFQLADQVKNKNKDLAEKNLLSLSYGKIKRKDINNPEGLLPESFDGYNIIEANDIVLRLTDLQNDHTSLRVGQAKEHGIITSAYTTIRPSAFVNPQYLYYVLHAYDLIKGFYGMGAGVRQGLNYDEVKAIKVPFPSVEEQRRIVAYLDDQVSQIDSIIEEEKASIEEYKQWKASTIFEAVTKGLRLDVAMKNTGLPFMPLIPKHWGRSKVGRFSLFFNGDRTSRYPKPEEFVDEGIAFLNSSNINGDIVDTSSCKYISAEKYDSLSGAKIEVGDIVYCLRGSIGKCALNTHLVEGTVASSLATIRPMGINGKYLLYCLLSKVAQEQVQIYMNGTCAANLSAESVSSFNIPFPPFEEQDTIGQYCFEKSSYFNNLIEEKQRLIDDLEQYKRSLIYEAVTGKRKVM